MSLDAAVAMPELQPTRAAASKTQGARGAAAALGTPGSFTQALDDAGRRADESESTDGRDADSTSANGNAAAWAPDAPVPVVSQDAAGAGANPASNPGDATAAATTSMSTPLTDPRLHPPAALPMGIDPAMLLAQGAMAGRDATPSALATPQWMPAAPSTSGVSGVGSAAGTSASVRSLADRAGTVGASAAGATSTAQGLFELPAAGAQGAHSASAARSAADAQVAAGQGAAATTTLAQRLVDRQEDLRAQLAPLVAARAAAAADVTGPPAAAEAGASLWASRSERHSERVSDTAGGLTATQGSNGAGAAASPLFAPVDAGSAAASGNGAGLAERMVEQVSWWLSQKTQGAEMTLDMANGQSVSVSVQVQGNEAQVAFRSDQADMRQMLTQAESQLKDLLGGQGLMLSGMSVGTQSGNAGQAAQQGEPDGRRDAHSTGRGTVAVAPEAVRAVATGPRAPSGRSLDLYV